MPVGNTLIILYIQEKFHLYSIIIPDSWYSYNELQNDNFYHECVNYHYNLIDLKEVPHHDGTVVFSKMEQQEDESGVNSHCLDLYLKGWGTCGVLCWVT